MVGGKQGQQVVRKDTFFYLFFLIQNIFSFRRMKKIPFVNSKDRRILSFEYDLWRTASFFLEQEFQTDVKDLLLNARILQTKGQV